MTAGNPHELWDFALRLYGAPGVGEACLILQDESGVDVPFLLFAAWLTANSVALPEVELDRIDRLMADWRNKVVKPLRALRRRLKNGPHPAPTTETETLRNSVKSIELNAERIELAMLETEGLALIAASQPRENAAGNLALVLRHFRGREPDAGAKEALGIVEDALAAL